LMVGTLESRKNIWGLANVWKQIVDKLGLNAPRLIFAGQRGWLSDDFYDFLHGTGYVQGYIRTVGDATDLELKYLYENCQFTVYPSYYEGWGLPVGESIGHALEVAQCSLQLRPLECCLLVPVGRLKPHAKFIAGVPNLVHFGDELVDFDQTAALLAALDLIITVDTAVAHLAAAMGKPAWILLPHAPEWRWLLDREDTPWYPNVRLFRQKRRDDWESVIERVRASLTVWAPAAQDRR